MNKKSVLPVGAAVAVAVAVFLHNPAEPFSGKVDAIHEAQVGELVIIEASQAKSYKWTILSKCPSDNYYLAEDGQRLIFSAVEVGEYVFVCAMAKSNEVELITHKIVVSPYKQSLKPVISRWLPELNKENKEIAKRLSVALRAVAGEATTVDDLISKSAEANRTILADSKTLEAWKPFLQKMAAYCNANLQDKSLEEHVSFWNEVATVLSKY